ncbi:hypothetical protein R3I93_016587 [Phoxinus phoxinus]|uniref:Endonuclease domain-containing 1 protein-like n=1 Tax=Phoxinus phoxinus TaxID=58324 RepID=A0AAN9CLG3_9TELE
MRLYVSSVVSALLLLLGFPFIMTKVVKSFSECSQFFFNGQPPVIPGVLESSVSKDYVLICQKYMKEYRFATLYDTANKIPIFSAYKFTGIKTGRPDVPWKIERQLEPSGNEMKVPFVSQASNSEYKGLEKLNRGHLFPNCHAADDHTAASTFTLTNVVPQRISFNSGTWGTMETIVKDFMIKHCRDKDDINKVLAYVLTGAVPGNNKLKERVNIPSHMWTVFCCYHKTKKSFISNAHWAENKDDNEDPVQSTSRGKRQGKGKKGKKTIPQISLKDLEESLRKTWPNIKLFDGCGEVVTLDENLQDKETDQNNCEEMDKQAAAG